MSMQGRDNESEAEPPDSLSLGKIKGISMSTRQDTFWQRKGGKGKYETSKNEKNAKESNALVLGHWSVTNRYSYLKVLLQSYRLLFS